MKQKVKSNYPPYIVLVFDSDHTSWHIEYQGWNGDYARFIWKSEKSFRESVLVNTVEKPNEHQTT